MDTVSRLSDNLKKLNDSRKSILSFVEGLTDKKSFVEIGAFLGGANFKNATETQGEGILTGYATISGIPVYLFAQNIDAMRGSFSYAQAEKIEKCVKMATKSGVPFVSIIDSAGARIDDATLLLEGYSKIIKLGASMKGVVPHIAIIKGTCVGLMSAYANQADVVIFDEKGTQTVVSPQVVKAVFDVNDSNDKVFNADQAIKAGTCSLKYKNVNDLKDKVYKVLNYLSGEIVDSDNPNRTAKGLSKNITQQNVINAICDNSEALVLNDGYANVYTAFARVNGYPVGVLALDGLLQSADFKKIKKFVNLLDCYNVPLITLVNSNGVKPDYKHELNGLSKVMADAFTAIALSDNPKISVIYGNAIGVSYSLLSAKSIGFDYTLAFENSSIAPLSSEQLVNFEDINLVTSDPIKEKQQLIDTYSLREGNPFIAAKEGFIDNIILADDVRLYLASALQMLL